MSENIWSTNVKATCVEKLGKGRHERGESHVFETPISYVEEMCLGIQDPARIWVTHCAAGLPSREGTTRRSTGSTASPRRGRSGSSSGSRIRKAKSPFFPRFLV